MSTKTDAPGPVKKKLMSTGCLVVLIIFAILGLACFAGTIAFFSSDAGGAMVEVLDQMKNGMSAPGAAEVKAAGCQVAIVLDDAEMEATFNKHFDAGLEPAAHAMTVTCSVASGADAPDCDALAQVYVKAVGGKALGPMTVLVQKANTEQCRKRYSDVGNPIP